MIVTILKGSFIKRGPKIDLNRDYSTCGVNNFRRCT